MKRTLILFLCSCTVAVIIWEHFFRKPMVASARFLEEKNAEAGDFEKDNKEILDFWSHDSDGETFFSTHRVEKGQSFSESLEIAGVVQPDRTGVLQKIATVLDLSRVPIGLHFSIRFKVDRASGSPRVTRLTIEPEPTRQIVVVREAFADPFQVSEKFFQLDTFEETYSGTVETSLWDSAHKAGMDPSLIASLSEIFAWEIDFEREVQGGDTWRIVVERKRLHARILGFGRILAAEYVNRQEKHEAVWFADDGRGGDYYRSDGSSLKRLFLKSPLRYARISSKFKGSRFHPILKRNIPHNGVDYAASPGTPVMTVGDGQVVAATRHAAMGIHVRVRHNGTYETAYLHLSGIANGIRKGQRVRQGQVIGYVGMTGLATGPHLHFSFYENGVFVDPLGKKFPSKDPISQDLMVKLQEISSTVLKKLPL